MPVQNYYYILCMDKCKMNIARLKNPWKNHQDIQSYNGFHEEIYQNHTDNIKIPIHLYRPCNLNHIFSKYNSYYLDSIQLDNHRCINHYLSIYFQYILNESNKVMYLRGIRTASTAFICWIRTCLALKITLHTIWESWFLKIIRITIYNTFSLL